MISDDVIEDITGGTPEGVIDVAKKVIATRCGRITVFQKGTGHRKSP